MKVSREKYIAIKRACMERQNPDKVASKFGVSCTTVRRIRGSLSYEAYKGSMLKKGSLTNATASGKKKAGSSSSTTKLKTSDEPKSNLNKNNKTTKKGEWKESPNLSIPANTKFGEIVAPIIKKVKVQEPVDNHIGKVKANLDGTTDVITELDKKTLKSEYNELSDKYDSVVDKYVNKCDELDTARLFAKVVIGLSILFFIGMAIAIIL